MGFNFSGTGGSSGKRFDFSQSRWEDNSATIPYDIAPTPTPQPISIKPIESKILPPSSSMADFRRLETNTPLPEIKSQTKLLDALSRFGKGFWQSGLRTAAEGYKADGEAILYAAQKEAEARDARLGITPTASGKSYINPTASSADIKARLENLKSQVPYEPTDTAGKIGSMAGFLAGSAPAFVLGGAATGPLAEKAIAKIAPKIAPKIMPYAERSIRDGLAFAPIGVMESDTLGEIPKNVATDVAIGAAMGPAFVGAGRLIGKSADSIKNALKPLGVPPELIGPPRSLAPAERSLKRGLGEGKLRISDTLTPEYKARQAELYKTRQSELENVFKDYQPPNNSLVTTKPERQVVDESLGIGRQARIYEGLDAFGKPLQTFKKNTDTQDAIAEISTKMTKQLNDIAKSLKQVEAQTGIESIRKKVKDMGGIRQNNDGIFEERRVIPNWIRNDKGGRPLDEVADTLGMTSDELLVAISDSSSKIRNYAAEAQVIANKDPDYLALSNTLETLKGELPGKRTLSSSKNKSAPINESLQAELTPYAPRPQKPLADSYDGYQKLIDDVDDVLISKYGMDDWLKMAQGLESKIPKSEVSGYNALVDARNKIWEAEKAGNIKNVSDGVDFGKYDKNKEWVADKRSVDNALKELQDDANWYSINKEEYNPTVEQIKESLYNKLIQSTDAPEQLWGEYRLAQELASDFSNSPLGRSTKPLLQQIDDIVNSMLNPQVAKIEPKLLSSKMEAKPITPPIKSITKSDVKLKPRELIPKTEPQPIRPQRITLSGNLPPMDAPFRPVKPIRSVSEQRTLGDVLGTEQNLSQLPKPNTSLKAPTSEIPKAGKLKINPPLPKEERLFWQSVSKELYSKGEQPPFSIELMKKDIVEGKLDISKLSNQEDIRKMLKMDLQKFAGGPEVTESVGPIRAQGELPGRNEPILPRDDGTIRPQVDRKPAKRKSFSEMWKEVRTQFVEDVAPMEKLERSVTGGLASAENSIYKQARLFRGSPEQAAEFVRSRFSPIMKQVEMQGKTVEDIGDYALAVHARDVNAKGIVSGFSDERIANTIAMHGTPEMEAARMELMKINNELLESLAEAGVIEKSLVSILREKHPNYMPLFRSFDDEKIEFASGISKALANVSSPIQRLKGSKRDVIDPIESMVKNVYKSISAVDRNKVALQLGPLADKDASGEIVRRLAKGEERSRLNAVYAMEDGQKVYYEVQPDVYKAIMGLDKESSLMLIKIFQQPASLLRAGATLTPEFSLRNPIRDIPAAFSVSNSGLNPVRDIPMALFEIGKSKLGKESLYNQFLKDNAGYGNIISTDRKVLQDAMKDVLAKPDNKFVNIINPKSWLRVLRGIADVSESATKLGEYRAALRSGASRPEAAYRARDIMDFGRAGASVREANKIVAFLNANIQGKSKIYRAIKEDPVGVTTRAFTSITVPTIGAFIAQKYLANDKQKEIIDNAEDWLTSTFWLLPVPGTDQVARIPKPFDLSPVFANLPERTLKYIFENDPEAFDGFAKQTIASAALPQMITALTPLIEGFANYSLFRQAPIIPQREAGLNYPDQYDIRTTETAKFIAKGVNELTGGQGAFKNFGSPRIIDNTIRGFTAGLGTYATSAIDYVAETTGLVEKKQKPARNVSELPLLRAFLTSEKSDKSLGKLYDEKDKLTRDKGSLKLESPKVKFPEEKRLKQLNEVTGKVGDITKEIRKIENDKTLTPIVKRDRINSLNEKRNILARKVME